MRDYSDTTMPDVSFYYDGTGLGSVPNFSKGKTTKVTSSVSETRYTSFDVFGRLLASEQRTPFDSNETISTATPRVSSYSFDAYGKLLSETYPSGRVVKMDYDQDGDVSSIYGTVGSTNRLYANGITYNSSGAIERLRLGNGKWESAKYNERLQITEIGLGNSAADTSLLKLEYGYGNNTENNGSLRSQKISFNGLTNPFEQTYSYDDLNRLQSAEEKVNNQTTWKQTFSYDRYGNRRFDANNTTTLGSCSQAVCNPLINTSDNRFSSGQGYTYDKDGNLTTDASGQQFIYDAENHQTEVKNSSNQTIGQYLYDGEGKRVKKISDTEITIFVYNGGGQLVAEYSTALSQTPQVSYLTNDHLGSPRAITNELGQITTRKDYLAFGDEASSSQRTTGLKYDSSETRKGYTGYEKDIESGLEFAQARYYNTTHGRFTSVDPLTASATIKNPQTFNRYSYVLNSPYKFTDPLGLISSSTGACGNWCINSGPTGGYSSNYSAGKNPTDAGLTDEEIKEKFKKIFSEDKPEPPPPTAQQNQQQQDVYPLKPSNIDWESLDQSPRGREATGGEWLPTVSSVSPSEFDGDYVKSKTARLVLGFTTNYFDPNNPSAGRLFTLVFWLEMGDHILTKEDLNYTYRIDNGSEFENSDNYLPEFQNGQHLLRGIAVSDDKAKEFPQWTIFPDGSGTLKITITPPGGQQQVFTIPYKTWIGGGFVELKITNFGGEITLP